jgi:putative ABC transport system substrate-binding protein
MRRGSEFHCFPGAAQHDAKRSDALQTRDRHKIQAWKGPGSAAPHFANAPRCTASGKRGIRRRDFITLLGGAAAAWPLAARAQQGAIPVVGFVRDGSADTSAWLAAAFRKGLNETGFVEGQNVTVEYHWLEGQYDRLPQLMADLVRRQVAVIATPGNVTTVAAKAATATIPIVFGVGDNPVRLGLVASLARPGGNATGINFFFQEVVAKRLRLMHELVPKAVRIAVLVNPANISVAENTVRDVQQAAPALGLQIQTLNASTNAEIDAAFATLSHEHADALFVAGDAFFVSRRVQLATLTARDRIPASYGNHESVEAGGLMSYGGDIADMFHQVGIYTGKILHGAKPADMPVQQSTKFEFVINLQTARALGIEVPPGLLSIADEVIE